MHLNHPEASPTPLTWSVENFSSMKLVPGTKEVGDSCPKGIQIQSRMEVSWTWRTGNFFFFFSSVYVNLQLSIPRLVKKSFCIR